MNGFEKGGEGKGGRGRGGTCGMSADDEDSSLCSVPLPPAPSPPLTLTLLTLLTLLSFSSAARAQVPDSAAVVGDTLAVPTDSLALPADSLRALADTTARRRPSPLPVGFGGPESGRVVSGVPARRPVAGATALLADVPGVFHYDLGVPGWADGVSFGGLAPHRASLTLDGIPATDLFSGRPAFELLPLDALAPLRLAPRYGTPAGVEADLRAFAASVPVTELRYRTGGGGIQFISATHGQTRRPGFVRRLGGDRARLHALFHVSGRQADGDYAGFDVSGWQAIGRIGIALPALSLEVTERHGRDRAGAPGGVAPTGVFDTVFDPDLALVLAPNAERETIRNDLAAALRLPVFGAPLTVAGYWTAETFRTIGSPNVTDTLEARGDRFGFRAVQPFRLGPHRLSVRAEGWTDETDAAGAFPDGGSSGTLHLAVGDSLALGGFDVGLAAGVHTGSGTTFPTFDVRVERSGDAVQAFVAARRAGALYGPMEHDGFADIVQATAPLGDERTLVAEAGLDVALGPFDLGLGAEAIQQTDPRLLLADADTSVTFVTAAGTFRRVTGTVRLGWRDRAARGVYLRAQANTHTFLNPDDSDLHRREADAVPPFWGTARLGFRALDLFDGALDLDLAVRGRGWTAFRGRRFHAPTALFALPPVDARPVDASGTLDVLAEAGIGGGRATVFVIYENALASRAYAGSYVVPVYPLPGPRLRFGVFWLLPN